MNKYHFINVFNDGEAHISKKCIKIKKYQKNKKINLRYVNSIMHIDVKINKTANVLCFSSFSFFTFFLLLSNRIMQHECNSRFKHNEK